MMARAARLAGAPVRLALLGSIEVYRRAISPLLADRCKYYPSCSSYAVQAIRERGALVGASLATWRLLRCNPFSNGGVDRVPPRRGGRMYDGVVHRRSAT